MNQTFQPRRILIFEAYTNANIGSGAVVENTVNLLKEKYPLAEIKIMAHCWRAFRYDNIESVPDVFEYPFLKTRLTQVVWLLKTFFWLFLAYLQALLLKSKPFLFFKEKVRYFQWADLVVSVGAERLNDKFVKGLVFSALSLVLLKSLGKKVVFFPSTIGPFFYPPTRGLSSHALRRLDLVFTRDRESTRICLEELALEPSRVVQTADVAVLQAQEPLGTSLDLIRNFRKGRTLSDDSAIVGLNALKWTYRANKKETSYSNYPSYLREMAALADGLVERYGVIIGFYPTNFPVNECREDDVSVCREIQERMTHAGSTFLVDRLVTPAQLKGMLACSRLNIVTRMHACILSTGAGIPTLSVNYLFKLREYMESLGLEKFSIDIEDFNARSVADAFGRMWEERDFWNSHIRKAMAYKREVLKGAMERMDDYLNSGNKFQDSHPDGHNLSVAAA
ncbi:MAG TPA: polysaccharide pyruvyl transferase family protein, partial [bacterium]|nr:polysaccharide pyruvyl transferase family protein [bacterium]